MRFVLQVEQLAKIFRGLLAPGSYLDEELLRIAMILGPRPLLQSLATGSIRRGDSSEDSESRG